jgi:hypothetical protein
MLFLNQALVRWLPKARLAHVGGGHRISPVEAKVVSFIQELPPSKVLSAPVPS